MPYCIPVCQSCRAGVCPRGEAPALPVSKPKKRRRAVVQATYPRDERPGYKLLKCGHYTDKASILFYSVWQPKGYPRKFYCDSPGCHRWVLPERITDSESDTDKLTELTLW